MVDYAALVTQNTAGIARFFREKWWLVLLIIFGIIAIYVYFHSVFRRVPRCLAKLDPYEQAMSLNPVIGCKKLIDNGYRLCDFYVSSAYRPYLPCNQRHDYGSLEMLTKSIRMGARYLELDIYNKDFCAYTDPVVCTGKQPGNWHYTTELNFGEVCNTIVHTAFSSSQPNATDPLFLSLNLHVDGNMNTVNTIGDQVKNHLGNWLLSSDYNYQRKNIAQQRLKNLMGRLVLFCDQPYKGTKLDEYINYTWKQPFMRSYTHVEILDLHEPQEVTDYNRKYMTKVTPAFTGSATQNYNPRTAWMLGCQFVAMNFGNPEENAVINWKKFRKCSFALKPYTLRFHPKYFKTPTPQTKTVSFAPKQMSSPNFSITY